MSLSVTGETRQTWEELLAWRKDYALASPDELWEFYAGNARTTLRALPPLWIAARVSPLSREDVARLCAVLALSRLRFNRAPTGEALNDELFLWELATLLMPRNFWIDQWEYVAGYSSPHHRMADLYRRAARTDQMAMQCYVDFFCSAESPTFDSNGSSFALLLKQGAVIDSTISVGELHQKLSWCFQLRLRAQSESLPWLMSSIECALVHKTDSDILIERHS